jgi:hypothetical protein
VIDSLSAWSTVLFSPAIGRIESVRHRNGFQHIDEPPPSSEPGRHLTASNGGLSLSPTLSRQYCSSHIVSLLESQPIPTMRGISQLFKNKKLRSETAQFFVFFQ